ncbi:glutamate receptor 2.7-like [Papaver somniferum]|nr:glutamate receptor 2.7-like [Papaver somniferum]
MVTGQNTTGEVEEFKVGVVIDANTSVAKVWLTCIDMALSDIYAYRKTYKRRLVLHVMDSKSDVLDASSAALNLIQNVKVQAIIGPTTSAQAINVAHLGKRYQVPIISFSATSPSISLAQNPYFIRTSLNGSSQVNAIAAIVKKFGWREVVPLYEDTEYGHGVIPYLMDAFQNTNTRVPYRSVFPSAATDDQITQELNKLDNMGTRVLILHMLSPLGLRVFTQAKVLGMMNKGYAWIITSGLGTDLNSFEPSDIDTMQGVLGIRPYISQHKEVAAFEGRWKIKFRKEYPDIERKLDIFGIWSYDTIRALASVVENFQTGPELLQELSNMKFEGLSGVFHLVNRQLQSDAFQILNICGSGIRDIGIWRPSDGTNKLNLRPVIWPGDATEKPKGWEIPLKDRKLRIGVPLKNGFNEFVKTTKNSCNGTRYDVAGYCIDVFTTALEKLPYCVPHEFIPYEKNESGKAGSYYDDLVHQVQLQNFDVVVGDVTITATRSQHVDFTLPYTEGGVSMIVLVKKDLSQDTWIFLKPLEWKLWVTTGAFFLLVGVVIWILEHRVNREFRGGPHSMYQWGTLLSFSFSMLVFAHKERVLSNLGRFVMGIWLFVVLILTQSYTANLASMLTIQRSDPTYNDVNQLIRYGYNVGYQEGTFVFGMLKRMGFDESNLKSYKSPGEFDEAFSKGRSEGGIVAAFEELPYIELILAEYCGKYMMVGDIYPYDGFGFVFPKGSPLCPDISRTILSTREEGRTERFKKGWFKNQKSCADNNDPYGSSNSLTLGSFWILFLITGICSALAVIAFLTIFFYENKQILRDPSITTRNKILNLLRKFCEHDENRLITYFEPPACSDQNKIVDNRVHATEINIDAVDSLPRIHASPMAGNVSARSDNSNAEMGGYTTLVADHNIASGNCIPADSNTRTYVGKL